MSLEDDLLAEGEPEKEFHVGIAARMPRKRAAAGVLMRDAYGRILFVDPIYKPFLDIPGGVVNENESPTEACRREVREELGIDLTPGRLLVVDWIPAHGVWGDGVMFIFDGGMVTSDQLAGIKLPDDELAAATVLSLADAAPRLKPSMARRLAVAVEAFDEGHPIYAEFGRPRTEPVRR